MAPNPTFAVAPARTPADLSSIARLFTAYATSLGIDLSFQDFSTELVGLPGKYAPPSGEILLARNTTGEPIGCVALRPLPGAEQAVCEMKRLYLTPAARGMGVGRALVETVVQVAEGVGYQEVRLDTLPSMGAAIKLYQSAGFVMTDAYYDTPMEGTIFLAKKLNAG